ncbi:MAG: NUDIX hydrolase N-terminal domain-containing protein [Anaerolineae bacterium]|nr:NUDIX hydrolase N-terminal domain-containing protein [Anaerolineae bacterium]
MKTKIQGGITLTNPDWLTWARKIQSIAKIGLIYCENDYDRERYEQLQELALEILEAHTDVPAEKISGLFQHEQGYPTPKVDVRGAVFNEQGEILLVKEAKSGGWTLPGGWADVWDTPSLGVEREVREESGFIVKANKLISVYDRDHQGHPPHDFAIYKITFLCEIEGGQATSSHETLAVEFFGEDVLPELDTGRTLESHLHLCFEHHRNPSLATAFN